MTTMDEIVSEIDIDDLDGKIVCYRCIAAGLGFPESLHHYDDMQGSPATSDLICPHCYDTEVEFGHERMSREESAYVFGLIAEFEKAKEQRLDSLYEQQINRQDLQE